MHDEIVGCVAIMNTSVEPRSGWTRYATRQSVVSQTSPQLRLSVQAELVGRRCIPEAITLAGHIAEGSAGHVVATEGNALVGQTAKQCAPSPGSHALVDIEAHHPVRTGER